MGIIDSGGAESGAFWAVVVAAGTLTINIVVAILNGISTLHRTRIETDDKIAAKDNQLTASLIALERRIQIDIDASLRSVGETMSAIRAKITEVELWGRDHYVDKSTFQAFAIEWRRSWERFEEKLDRRLDKIDEKLDVEK
jgi:hypothetical protein